MALSQSRIELRGNSNYPWEQAAIEFAIAELPNSDPYRIWCLIDFVDASTGRLAEIDMLVLGYNALYLIEAKSGPGTYTGNDVDWWREYEGQKFYMDPPLRATNSKAKILASRLKAKLKDRKSSPWVQPLVFLSDPDAKLHLDPAGRVAVIRRDEFLRAVKFHEIPGVTPRRLTPISRPQAKDIAQALAQLGFREREGTAKVGDYKLESIVHEGSGYQDWDAVHDHNPKLKRRARVYLVPSQTSVERRQQLRRAALRESTLLHDIRDHANVLRCTDYVADAPLGPTVLFDSFDGGVPLDAFVRQTRDLDLAERVSIVEQVGRALAHCHRKQVIHGGLSPDAVLARRNADGAIETRLYNLQLGFGHDADATSHWTELAQASWKVYQAPELLQDTNNRTVHSDIFALGALAYFVLTGRAPAIDFIDAQRILSKRQCFDPLVASDSIPPRLAEVVSFATQISFTNRPESAAEWVELFVSEGAPAPEPIIDDEPPPTDPLTCRGGDVLVTQEKDELLVLNGLGHGSTARVLLVERDDGRQLALKVSLSTDHDAMLAAEGAALATLRHSQIVTFANNTVVAERPCILMARAGDETLHTALGREGSLSLDYASRYGDDLLNALEYLENEQVIHRDIKPGNIGVGSSKKKSHELTLFDFSLVNAPLSNITVGTSAYRDPFLFQRGAWDHAADRYSAAVTLHQMLTGVMPSYGAPGTAAIDPDAELRLAAERFDSAVRDKLVAFFDSALARDLEGRFGNARQMRTAWNKCFTASDTAPPPIAPDEIEPRTTEALAAIEPETPIDALPLSVRAKNALDRAGLSRAVDLLALADNRISAIRGIGSKVATDILSFRNAWKAARDLDAERPPPFFASYIGDDKPIEVAIREPVLAQAVADAGLTSLGQLAAAPTSHLETLAERSGIDLSALRAILDAENKEAAGRDRPSSLKGWIAALVGGNKKSDTYIRQLLGLEAPMLGRLDASAKEVAEAASITPPRVYQILSKSADTWRAHPAAGELEQMVSTAVSSAGGIAALADAGGRLLERLDFEPDGHETVRAAALCRIAAEVAKETDATINLVRINGGLWLSTSDAHAAAARRLGDVADGLARRKVIASPGEAERMLSEAAADTPLAHVATDRLPLLAATASKNAALSSRLEIYPRNMAAKRALELTASAITNELSAVEIRGRVAARYPQAKPLPERPALDALLTKLGLRFDPERAHYERPGDSSGHATSFSSISVVHSTPYTGHAPPPPADVERHEFDDKLRSAIERRRFRVLAVGSSIAVEATIGLRDRLGLEVVSLDELFAKELDTVMDEESIDPAVVYDIDGQGPTGPEWDGLLKLAGAVAHRVGAKLAAINAPTLVINPGLLARYQLRDALKRIVTTAKTTDAGPVMLLIPTVSGSGIPLINNRLEIPALERSDVLWIPRSWVGRVKAARAS